MMYDLNDGDCLYSETVYSLQRDNGCMYIVVRELVAGKDARFHAFPRLNITLAPQEYCGEGDTMEQALSACLKKIKHADYVKDLFPHMEGRR